MRTQGRIIAVVALGFALAGCRAQVGGPDDLGDDGGEDLSIGDASDDQGDGNPSCPGTAAAEDCNNNCDDDGNGYTDADDPACSTQLLVTTQSTSTSLSRLILDPTPKLVALDGNMVAQGGMAMYNRHLSAGNAFLAFTGINGRVARLTLSSSGTGTINNYTPAYTTRDVCTFHGELIVVERSLPSVLHRFMPDGKSEIGQVSLGNVVATACASDGNLLYVAVHDQLPGTNSTFQVYDATYTQQGTAVPMPTAIANFGTNGLDRCIDFAWSERSGFWGLFVNSTVDYPSAPANDNGMSSGQLFPFAFDGGAGAPVDAGMFYGVGEFVP